MNSSVSQGALRLFSIVIPSYNYGHFIGRAIESVASQSGDDYEIVVVDDGSTDQSAEVLAPYRDRLGDRLSYVYQENRGLGAARNRGVRLAGGEFVLFLDADDSLTPDVLGRLRAFLESSPDCDYIVGDHILVHTKGKVVHRSAFSVVDDGAENVRSFFRSNFAAICNGSVLVRRRVFDRIAFPEAIRRWQDRVFYSHLFALYRGKSVRFPFLTVFRHDDSLSHQLSSILEDGMKSVPLLFDPAILSPDLMQLEREYIARTQLFLFQACYSRGLHAEARRAFHRAFRARPAQVLRSQPLRRYLKTLLKFSGAKHDIASSAG